MFPNNKILHIYLHLCLLKQVPYKPLSQLTQIICVHLHQISSFLQLEQTQQSVSFFPGNVLIPEHVCCVFSIAFCVFSL